LEQRQVNRPKATAEAERNLDNTDSSPECPFGSRSGAVQRRNDSKLRGCDLVNLRVRDVMHGSQVLVIPSWKVPCDTLA
jgi:hypothetical protein